MKGNDIRLTLDGYRAVIETMRILIKAGSETAKRCKSTLWTYIYYAETNKPCKDSALAIKMYYQFILEVSEILIKNMP